VVDVVTLLVVAYHYEFEIANNQYLDLNVGVTLIRLILHSREKLIRLI
jgi:hypothetical protein